MWQREILWATAGSPAKNLINEKQLAHMLVHLVRTNESYQKNFYGISRGEKCR
jgi:hypothetical protein